MRTGVVITALARRSFVFIQDAETGEEFFAHKFDFPNNALLPVGTLVEFELGTFKNRQKAIKIRPLASKSASSVEDFEVRG